LRFSRKVPLTFLEYTDDSVIIPKNTSVIVRRVPAASGRRFFQPRTLTARTGMARPSMPSAVVSGGEEQNKIAAMMSETSSHWTNNQEMPSQYQFTVRFVIYSCF
jgi:hypothetical protein